MLSRTIRAFLLLMASAVAACGGGSDAAPRSTAIRVPTTTGATPAFTLTPPAIKSFRFNWNDAADETGYRLFEDPDGASGYSPIAELPANTTQYEHEVFLPERVNARYRLQVCKNLDCVDAAELGVSGNLAQAIGYFKASDPADNDRFGYGLAFSANGQFLAVGAPNRNASNGGSGKVHVFSREGTAWQQRALLKSPTPQPSDQFGSDLAWSTDGDTLAVGAPGTDARTGAVFVFTREGATWGSVARVEALNAGLNDQFGQRIALSGDGRTLAAGAENESGDASTINGPDNDNKRSSGAAYVFTHAGGGWTQQAYIKAFNPDPFDFFGRALALSADGQTLAVGAPGESSASRGIGGDPDDNTVLNSGAVYVFSRSMDSWHQQAYVKASNTQLTAEFGGALALSADGRVMAVGSLGESGGATGIDGDQDNTAGNRSGAAYVFGREGTQWRQTSYIKASNAEADDLFGASVALSIDGGTLAVGALAEGSDARGLNGDQGSNESPRVGAVYVYRHAATGWRQEAYLKPSNTVRGHVSGFGAALALSGRLDGTTTQGMALAVACPYASNTSSGIGGDQTDKSGSDVGAVYLY